MIQNCIISEIYYHGMLVELPRISIEGLVDRYEEIELSQVDDIMFFGLHANLCLFRQLIPRVMLLTRKMYHYQGGMLLLLFLTVCQCRITTYYVDELSLMILMTTLRDMKAKSHSRYINGITCYLRRPQEK